MISVQTLRYIMPLITDAHAQAFVQPLEDAMELGEINTPLRQAMFLAQLAHESGEFRYMRELASGKEYEGRHDLGNVHDGDGEKYKGRGPIQITGYDNYQKCSLALFNDERLLDNPGLLEQPEVGCVAAAWFWGEHKLNEFADLGDIRTVTKRINGGYNGIDMRQHYYTRAKEALGVE